MKICITVGHSILKSGASTSADGVVSEYQYCKGLAPVLANVIRKEGHTVDVIICPERQFTSKNQEQSYKLPRINGKGYDLVVELHLNSSDNSSAQGVETIYHQNSSKGKAYAERIEKKISELDIRSRGAKKQTEFKQKRFYMLSGTDCPAVIIESFFCTNQKDYNIAKDAGYEGIAKLIAEGILNKSIESENNNIMKRNCVLYSNDEDRTIAEVLEWSKEDCVVKDVKDFRSYMAENLFVVGGKTEEELKKMNLPDRYTVFNGIDRWGTLEMVLKFLDNI